MKEPTLGLKGWGHESVFLPLGFLRADISIQNRFPLLYLVGTCDGGKSGNVEFGSRGNDDSLEGKSVSNPLEATVADGILLLSRALE